MALFSKEAEKVPQPAKPPVQPIQGTPPPSYPEDRGAGAKLGGQPAPGAVGAPEGRAYLDKGCKVSGKLLFEGPARIDGQVDGEINANDTLFIGEGAVVTAQVKASSVTVAGKLSGDITATKRIEIRPSAKVLGNLASPILVIHEGAMFEGHCVMQTEAAREDHKVTLFPKEERLAQVAGQKPA